MTWRKPQEVSPGLPHGQSEGPPRLAQAHPHENSRRRRPVAMWVLSPSISSSCRFWRMAIRRCDSGR